MTNFHKDHLKKIYNSFERQGQFLIIKYIFLVIVEMHSLKRSLTEQLVVNANTVNLQDQLLGFKRDIITIIFIATIFHINIIVIVSTIYYFKHRSCVYSVVLVVKFLYQLLMNDRLNLILFIIIILKYLQQKLSQHFFMFKQDTSFQIQRIHIQFYFITRNQQA